MATASEKQETPSFTSKGKREARHLALAQAKINDSIYLSLYQIDHASAFAPLY